MAVALDLVAMTVSDRFTERIIKLTFSGSYVQFGTVTNNTGEAIDFTAMTNTTGLEAGKQFGAMPVAAYELVGSGGYYFEIIKSQATTGATLKNYRIKIFAPAGTEVAAGAYPAALAASRTSDLLMAIQTVTGK